MAASEDELARRVRVDRQEVRLPGMRVNSAQQVRVGNADQGELMCGVSRFEIHRSVARLERPAHAIASPAQVGDPLRSTS